MFIRSEVRHTCYRMKNGGTYRPQMQHIVDYIESIRTNQKWEEFSEKWDVFVTPENVTLITPEVDNEFISATCTKIKTMVELGVDPIEKLTVREQNVMAIIELNYSGREVPWVDFNETWGVRVLYDDKRFEPYMYSTQVNEVPEPEPVVVGEPEPIQAEVSSFQEMTPEEQEVFKKMIKKMNL